MLTANNLALGRKPFPEKLVSASTYCYTADNATNGEKKLESFLNTDNQDWTAEQIVNREVALLQFASTRWNIGCSADNIAITIKLNGDDYVIDEHVSADNCHGTDNTDEATDDDDA